MSRDTRWLSLEERRAWIAYVNLATLLEDHLNRQLRRDAGLTHADYTLLSHLSAAPDRSLSMSTLAERLKSADDWRNDEAMAGGDFHIGIAE